MSLSNADYYNVASSGKGSRRRSNLQQASHP
jgi:hypothetical protein